MTRAIIKKWTKIAKLGNIRKQMRVKNLPPVFRSSTADSPTTERNVFDQDCISRENLFNSIELTLF